MCYLRECFSNILENLLEEIIFKKSINQIVIFINNYVFIEYEYATWCNHYGGQCGVSSKTWERVYHTTQLYHSWE